MAGPSQKDKDTGPQGYQYQSTDAPGCGSGCGGCDMPCHQACLRNAFRSGAYERSICSKENTKREAEAEMLDGSIMGVEEPSRVTKPCRFCELACPVARGDSL